MNKEANQIKSIDEKSITNIPEEFCEPLIEVACKLLSGDEATFEELKPKETSFGPL